MSLNATYAPGPSIPAVEMSPSQSRALVSSWKNRRSGGPHISDDEAWCLFLRSGGHGHSARVCATFVDEVLNACTSDGVYGGGWTMIYHWGVSIGDTLSPGYRKAEAKDPFHQLMQRLIHTDEICDHLDRFLPKWQRRITSESKAEDFTAKYVEAHRILRDDLAHHPVLIDADQRLRHLASRTMQRLSGLLLALPQPPSMKATLARILDDLEAKRSLVVQQRRAWAHACEEMERKAREAKEAEALLARVGQREALWHETLQYMTPEIRPDAPLEDLHSWRVSHGERCLHRATRLRDILQLDRALRGQSPPAYWSFSFVKAKEFEKVYLGNVAWGRGKNWSPENKCPWQPALAEMAACYTAVTQVLVLALSAVPRALTDAQIQYLTCIRRLLITLFPLLGWDVRAITQASPEDL